MPYKNSEKQREAMRQIAKRKRRECRLALQFIKEKDLMGEFEEFVKKERVKKNE
jgi:hypothetical protein